jgi:hypothetical protein
MPQIAITGPELADAGSVALCRHCSSLAVAEDGTFPEPAAFFGTNRPFGAKVILNKC